MFSAMAAAGEIWEAPAAVGFRGRPIGRSVGGCACLVIYRKFFHPSAGQVPLRLCRGTGSVVTQVQEFVGSKMGSILTDFFGEIGQILEHRSWLNPPSFVENHGHVTNFVKLSPDN
jgi:hypothetical protein